MYNGDLPNKFDADMILSSNTPGPFLQRDIVHDVLERQRTYQVKAGDLFYLVSQSWYRSWKMYVSYAAAATSTSTGAAASTAADNEEEESEDNFSPGSISNEELCCGNDEGHSPTIASEEELLAGVGFDTIEDLDYRKLIQQFDTIEELRDLALLLCDKTAMATTPTTTTTTTTTTTNNNTTIDNNTEQQHFRLKPPGTILEDVDFVLLPKKAYDFLFHWYGGGPTLERKVVINPVDRTKYWVELYPIKVVVLESNCEYKKNDGKNPLVVLDAAPTMTILTLKQMASAKLGLAYHSYIMGQLLNTADVVNGQGSAASLGGRDGTVVETKMESVVEGGDVGVVVVEVGDGTEGTEGTEGNKGNEREEGKQDHLRTGTGELGFNDDKIVHFFLEDNKTFDELHLTAEGTTLVFILVMFRPNKCLEQPQYSAYGIGSSPKHYSGCSSDGSGFSYKVPGAPQDQKGKFNPPGVTGLRNLGNTCFMNAVLQSLSAIPTLVDAMTTNSFTKDLIQHNMYNDSLIYQTVVLLRKMWCGEYDVVAPYQWKATLSKCAPRFAGYQQHDASELLNHVLNTLQEEWSGVANRILEHGEHGEHGEKMNAEDSKPENNDDTATARHSIESMFGGSYLSTTVCASCNETSTNKEMFYTIPLSFPASNQRLMKILCSKFVVYRFGGGGSSCTDVLSYSSCCCCCQSVGLVKQRHKK